MNTSFGRKLAAGISLLAASTLVLTGCSGGGDGGDGDSRVIKVGSTGQSFPNGYQEDGELVGYDVEMIEQAAEGMGAEVEWTTAEFSGIMGQFESGRLDTVANNVAVTPERSDKFDFSTVYAYMGAQVVTTGDNDEIAELEDLDGKTVSGVLGSNNLDHIENWAKENGVSVEVRPYETRDGAMEDMLAGRVDAYINSEGLIRAEDRRSDYGLKYVGDPIAYDEIALPFTRAGDNDELREELSAQIDAMLEDGRLAELSEKYFGTDVTQPID